MHVYVHVHVHVHVHVACACVCACTCTCGVVRVCAEVGLLLLTTPTTYLQQVVGVARMSAEVRAIVRVLERRRGILVVPGKG